MDRGRARLSARRDELRRVVYGAPGGHESDAVAELVAVERELAHLRETRTDTAESTAGVRFATGTSDQAIAADSKTSRWLRRWRRPALGAAALLGVGLAVAVALGPMTDLIAPPRGLEVFDRARDDVDAGPRAFVAVLGADAVSSLRSIGRAADHDVWVFRDDGGICMIAQTQHRSSWGANCVSEAEFTRTGIRQFITYDELSALTRPAGLDPASAVALLWTERSATVEWSIVPRSLASTDGVWIWVPIASDGGAAPMRYEEWSSSGLATRSDGS